MSLGFSALPEQVIIRYESNRPTEHNGIHLAAPEHEPIPFQGDVVAVGEGVTDVIVGDHVLFNQDKPDGFKHDGGKYLRVWVKNITAIHNENPS